ncbi:MAG: UDP-3-O-[3-hydroxymyristoyl] N-acetylglucosamine deacetylase [Verrucomicrobia bacterium]|nr:UDP-3-O-[3-hydroxymyristoyl] N-acetylglucosamine deacetylase [Verrucomicrobiota bacterium]
MVQQQTLRQSASFSGLGLHSGNRVTMTFLPAPPNTGIRFRRVDLNGRPEIEASVDHVSETTRSTTLSKGNIKVQTVEHVLAALRGMDVDNAFVELDANEPPIGDGSARQYTRMIEEAGTVVQAGPRAPHVVTTPLELSRGDSMVTVFPHDRLKLTCTSADKQGRFVQFCSLELSPETWKRDLAHARTFCFYDEIEHLIRNGLIKGGSLENAVVIRDDAVLTTEPLRYADEFVRHKMLDMVGDLSLLGRPLAAHVVAVKPSHTLNCELARLIHAQIRRPILAAQSFTPPPSPPAQKPAAPPATGPAAAPATATATVSTPMDTPEPGKDLIEAVRDGATLDTMQIMQILPHRYPFLMVDRITSIQGNTITGIKNLTINEPFFQGHFPNHPIMPGVLQLEAMAQVAGILMLKQADNYGRIAYFMSAENVKWRKPVRPGDVLRIEIQMLKSRGKIGKAKGVCSVAGETVSEAEVTFMLLSA